MWETGGHAIKGLRFMSETNPRPFVCMRTLVSTFSSFLSGSIPERIWEKSKCALITKGYLATLNQRVQGSSPCAPTKTINKSKCYNGFGRLTLERPFSCPLQVRK